MGIFYHSKTDKPRCKWSDSESEIHSKISFALTDRVLFISHLSFSPVLTLEIMSHWISHTHTHTHILLLLHTHTKPKGTVAHIQCY